MGSDFKSLALSANATIILNSILGLAPPEIKNAKTKTSMSDFALPVSELLFNSSQNKLLIARVF